MEAAEEYRTAPCVSVVIATRNRALLLPEAVRSAWAAAGELPIEVIVVDDASTDATPQLCAGWPGVRTLRLARNAGLAAARNHGIRAATGKYIALLDDDDERLPCTLPRLVAALEQSPAAAFVYAQTHVADGSPSIR